MSKIKLHMVDEIQCPGCIHGTDPEECSKFELIETTEVNLQYFYCKNWHPSTFIGAIGRIALGLPKGFCRTGVVEFGNQLFSYYVRLYEKPEHLRPYDKFNVAVWAMERDGYLFVRCYCPRENWLFVDVVKDGKLEQAPGAIDVGKFYDEID